MPKKTEDDKKIPFQLMISPDMKERLRVAAFEARVSEAEIVRRSLERYLKNR